MAGEHFTVVGRRREWPSPDADALGFGRRLGSHVVCRFFRQRDRHSCFDQRSIDVDLAGLADCEHPAKPVHPALLAFDFLRADDVEQGLRRCRRAIPNLGSGIAGLTLNRRVDPVEDDTFAVEAQQGRSDHFRCAPIDRRVIRGCSRSETEHRNKDRHYENFARHGEE